MDVADRTVSAGGIDTHYLEAGDPAGRPVVLLHGGGAGADSQGNWSGVIPRLAERYRVLAMDLVGFGGTAKPDPATYTYSQDGRNRHLATFLEVLDLAPAALVGNSMGGATALGVAMTRPELVDRMVLMGSAGLNTEITPALAPILRYDFTLEGMQRLVDGLTGPRYRAPDALVKRRYEASLEPETQRAYGAVMQWIGQQGGLFYDEEEIAKVRTPTLVVNGKQDLVVPPSCAYRFLELLENSWGHLIPHCGHWAMIEATDEFVAQTVAFLERDVEAFRS